MNMSYDSSNLTTPDIKWLGVRPSDLDRFNIPQQCRLPMTEEDIKTGKKLVRRGGRLCHTVAALHHCCAAHKQALLPSCCAWHALTPFAPPCAAACIGQ